MSHNGLRWYGDNSELKGIVGAEIPDILMFGGITVTMESSLQLQEIIKTVKIKYAGSDDFPIKWNLRDLHDWFINNGKAAEFKTLQERRKEWLTDLIQSISKLDFTIFSSVQHFYSKNSEKIKINKNNVSQYCFSNALMRLGLHGKGLRAARYEVVLDWPDGNLQKIFTQEYRSAYYAGRSHCINRPSTEYLCGNLKSLNFSDSVFFSKTEECSLLQLSDIILGLTRSLVEYSLRKKDTSDFGVILLPLIFPRFYGFPENILGRGLSISPSKGTFKDAIETGIGELFK